MSWNSGPHNYRTEAQKHWDNLTQEERDREFAAEEARIKRQQARNAWELQGAQYGSSNSLYGLIPTIPSASSVPSALSSEGLSASGSFVGVGEQPNTTLTIQTPKKSFVATAVANRAAGVTQVPQKTKDEMAVAKIQEYLAKPLPKNKKDIDSGVLGGLDKVIIDALSSSSDGYRRYFDVKKYLKDTFVARANTIAYLACGGGNRSDFDLLLHLTEGRIENSDTAVIPDTLKNPVQDLADAVGKNLTKQLMLRRQDVVEAMVANYVSGEGCMPNPYLKHVTCNAACTAGAFPETQQQSFLQRVTGSRNPANQAAQDMETSGFVKREKEKKQGCPSFFSLFK